MPIGIYTDVHIPRAIIVGLRLRGIDVLTAQEDGMGLADDPRILDRARELGMAVFTHDNDFLKEVSRRSGEGRDFGTVIFAHQLKAPTGQCIDDIELIARALDSSDLPNTVEFIPY